MLDSELTALLAGTGMMATVRQLCDAEHCADGLALYNQVRRWKMQAALHLPKGNAVSDRCATYVIESVAKLSRGRVQVGLIIGPRGSTITEIQTLSQVTC